VRAFARRKYWNFHRLGGWPDCCFWCTKMTSWKSGSLSVLTRKESTSKRSLSARAPRSRLSEAALLKRARRRDIGAFEELVARTEVRSYRLAVRYVRNESDAQEILQESYLAAWTNLPRFEERAHFASWMYRIVVNASLMRLRRRKRHPEVALHDVSVTELDQALDAATASSRGGDSRRERPDDLIQSAELLRYIGIAVDSLPEKLREVFLLRHVWDVSTGEAAARLGLSTPATKTRLHRARTELRQSLGEYVGC